MVLVYHHQVAALEEEIARLRTIAAYWESEAVLRASTLANDLTLRTREAELEAARIRRAVEKLAADDLSAESLRARLDALSLDS